MERNAEMATVPHEELVPGEGESATDLMKEAFVEARELARLEVTLAKNEAVSDLKELRASGIAFGFAAACGLVGFAVVLVAVSFALGGWLASLVAGLVLVAAGGVGGFVGVSHLPKQPFGETKRRLEEDMKQLKEHIA
jgi:hypothetical protein